MNDSNNESVKDVAMRKIISPIISSPKVSPFPIDAEKKNKIISKGFEISKVLEEKKAENIIILDLQKVQSYIDLFIIASANSIPHLVALSNEMYKSFGKEIYGTSQKPSNEESYSGWVVIDMIDILIHLFIEDQRKFYNLERLWGDAEILYSNSTSSNLN